MAKSSITMNLLYSGSGTASIQMSHQSGYGRLAVIYPTLTIGSGQTQKLPVEYDDGMDFWFFSWSKYTVEGYVPLGTTGGSLLVPPPGTKIPVDGASEFTLELGENSDGSTLSFTFAAEGGMTMLRPPEPVPVPLKRKSVASLTANERARYVTAVKAMKAQPSQFVPRTASRYDDYVYIHMQAMAGFGLTLINPTQPVTNSNWLPGVPAVSPAHRGPAFLPWHREFLHQFELDLQKFSPPTYDDKSPMGVPYWDWSKNFNENEVPWLSDFMGGNGVNDYVENGVDIHVVSGPVTVGPFASGNWPITLSQDRLPFLVRQFGLSPATPRLPIEKEVTAALEETVYDQEPWSAFTQPPSFRNHLEGAYVPTQPAPPPALVSVGMHNLVHGWVGGNAGTMLHSTSPNDPIFFLHHSNIDRLWAKWQRRNTNYLSPTPLTPFYAPANPIEGRPGQGLNEAMQFYSPTLSSAPPWSDPPKTPAQVLDHHALNYYYDDEES